MYVLKVLLYGYTPQGVNMARCVTNGQLHFVDCFTQLLTRSVLSTTVDANGPLKSYSLEPT